MRLSHGIFLLASIGTFVWGGRGQDVVADASNLEATTPGREVLLPPLPRWREGGTPYDPTQSLHPHAIEALAVRDAPTTGLIESPPEYGPTRGVLFFWVSTQWPTVVTDLVVALTADPQYDEIAYVVVPNTAQQALATEALTIGGADMSKVEFIIKLGEALWIRDYGPHFIWQGGALALVDSNYYPTRAYDNFTPTVLGDDHFIMPTYDMGLYYSGGNFQAGPDRTAFVTSLVDLDNPTWEGFSAAFIAELYARYQGIDTLHVMPQLPSSVDGTGHIDMWMHIVDEDSVMISQFKPGSHPTAITITDNAATYMENLGFNVYRPWAWNAGGTHYTYTNGFRVNDRIFVPAYGEGNPDYLDEDLDARMKWAIAAGHGVEIIPIDSYDIIPAAGAIHCIVMQVPRCTAEVPAVHVISPAGGELLAGGATHTISWVATDTDNLTIPQIELQYSTDGGESYELITTTTNTGLYDWTVPYVVTDQALVRVVAHSSDLDQGWGTSAEVFEIALLDRAVYDFTSGGGTDKFGWGYQTHDWDSDIHEVRTPVINEVDTLVSGAYGKLAYSDATGGDFDSNRYIAPNPTSHHESTHVFEFTIDEAPQDILDIEILWEGFSDQCAQIELYLWDDVQSAWSDGGGLYGQNRFMDNWAGNRDGYLEGHIRADFDRYINDDGILTLLSYSERGPDGQHVIYNPSFHDYVSVTVSVTAAPPRPLLPEDSLSTSCVNDGECPGEARCVAHVCYAPKQRYLSIARNPEQPPDTARRIRLDTEDLIGWVGEPYYVPPSAQHAGLWVASLISTPHYETEWPEVLHVTGCGIAHAGLCDVIGTHCKPNACPGGETCVHHSYHIQAIRIGRNVGDEDNYTEPLMLHTPTTWGDTVWISDEGECLPPDGVIGLDDIMAAIRFFQGKMVAPVTWLDIAPSMGSGSPDQYVGLGDIMEWIAAFQGRGYPGDGPLQCSD